MKNFRISTLLLLLATCLFACNKSEEDTYKGKNQIYIDTPDDHAMYESDEQPLNADIIMTRACTNDVKFVVSVNNTTNGLTGLTRLEPDTVTIKAGEKVGKFKLFSNRLGLLIREVALELSIEKLPEPDMEMKGKLNLTLKPGPRAPKLTEEQITLINGYKTSLGLDLTKWIGLIDVKVTIEYPGNSGLAPFVSPFTKEFTGKTVITLSEKATASQPVMKMTDNPMGLTAYQYDVLRKETVENDEYWYNAEGSKIYTDMLTMIKLSKTSQESFSMSLDNLRFSAVSAGKSAIEFTGIRKDSYDSDVTVVPFDYKYSAWDRLKALIDAGNEDAINNANLGATVEPEFFLTNTGIDADNWGNEPSDWIEASGSLDTATNKMTFVFCIDHHNAGGYTKVTVEYSLK